MRKKEKEEIRKSDVIEIYDRCKRALYDLSGIAYDKKCDISISINDEGKITLSVKEDTAKYMYIKNISQDNMITKYEEITVKR